MIILIQCRLERIAERFATLFCFMRRLGLTCKVKESELSGFVWRFAVPEVKNE
jgi:hypothetical protein